MKCWICGNIANSGEHKIKKIDDILDVEVLKYNNQGKIKNKLIELSNLILLLFGSERTFTFKKK
jgi:hypothetical protein